MSEIVWTVRTRGSAGGEGVYAEPLTFTYSPEPVGSPPINAPALSFIAKDETSIQLEWTSVDDATIYVLERDGVEFDQGGNLSYNDAGLNYNTTYIYRIRAGNEYGPGPWSDELVVTTDDYTVIPDDPSNVKMLYLRRV